MKIVCEECDARGEPASVQEKDGAVALECATCGHLNLVGGATSEEAREDGGKPQKKRDSSPNEEGGVDENGVDENGVDENGVVIPHEPAVADNVPPVQCRKCGHRQAAGTDSCNRCGFVFGLDDPGEMSWDRLARLPEAREAQELWQRSLQHGTATAHQRFVEFCEQEGLLEFAGRKYRFRRANRPDDVHAKRELEKMVQRGRTALSSQLEAVQESIRGDAAGARRKILLWVFIVGLVLALLFLSLYPNLF